MWLMIKRRPNPTNMKFSRCGEKGRVMKKDVQKELKVKPQANV